MENPNQIEMGDLGIALFFLKPPFESESDGFFLGFTDPDHVAWRHPTPHANTVEFSLES